MEKQRPFLSSAFVACMLAISHCFAQADEVKLASRKFDYVGACVSTHPRLEKIPDRIYEDFDGHPVDAIAFMRHNGFNAWRLFSAWREQPSKGGDDNVVKDGRSIDHREANFALDFESPADALAMAKRLNASGGKILLTLQFGQDGPVDNWHEYIPKSWLDLTYAQTLDKIDAGTRALLRPYLQASIQPDVIIVENEADSGMLFQYLGEDGKMKIRDTATHPNDTTAGGHYQNYPKLAGYLKREILSARDEIRKSGFDPEKTRFALHTTGNPYRARSTFDRVFRNKPDADRVNYDSEGNALGEAMAVPAELRNVKLSDLIDIMGFSVYPGELKGVETEAARATAFHTLIGNLEYFDPFMQAFGRFESGPFKGEFRKRALAIEFATRDASLVPTFFQIITPYDWMLGGLWWEPTYGSNNWYGSEGSLYRRTKFDKHTQTWTRLKPVPWLKVWGSFGK